MDGWVYVVSLLGGMLVGGMIAVVVMWLRW
jgi:hypothetical protein